ncbi:MAG: Ig-like domain-containing protein, partial [Phycisphaerae bacterium]
GTPGSLNAPIDRTPPTAPTGVLADVAVVPGTRIELTWTAAVEPDSYVDHYVIYRDGEEVGTSETTAYADADVTPATPYSYRVSAVNRDWYEGGPSDAAEITIPGVESFGVPGSTTIRLTFTEAIQEASAELATNYALTGGTVSAATLQPDSLTVHLTTSELVSGQGYTVTVAGLDTISGTLMPAGQDVAFEYYPSGSSAVLREYWTGIGGGAVSDLTGNANYPDNPDRRNFPALFEAPVNWADSYGTRMRGYVHPPVSGYYTFWIASDDNGKLYLSTDSDPDNKVLIASVPSWTGSRQWYTHPSQQSVEIYLSAGLRYYIEAVQKEGAGGDNLAVAWQRTGGAFEGPIPGAYLSPYVIDGLDNSPPSAPSNVDAQAYSSIRVDVTWSAAADGESGVAYYVVFRNGVEIGTSATLGYSDTTAVQTQTYTYSVSAVNGDGFEGGAAAAAAVTPKPGIDSVSPVSATELLVTFGKPVTEATAEIVGNYDLTGAGLAVGISTATWDPAHTEQVTLTLSEPLAENVLYTLTVTSVEDQAGNPMEPNAAVQFLFAGLDPDLLAWWTFDIDSGSITRDLTGNDRHLDVFGAEWSSLGRIGGAYQFDGSAGDYLFDEEAESYINGLSGFTFAAWIEADALGTDSGFYSLRTPTTDERYGFRHDAQLQNQSNAPNGFRGGVRATGGTQEWESLPGRQTTDWQHVAITWASGQDIQVYLDGILQTAGWIGASVSGTITGAERLLIGRGTKDGGSSWRGLIDDVRIYADALSEAEVVALIDPRPVAQDDAYEVTEGGALAVVGSGVLANDFDPDPGPAALTAELVDDVSHGMLDLSSDGSFDYTPTGGYTGPDSFTYRAYDGADYSGVATVHISVVDAIRLLSVEAIDNTHVDVLFSTDLDAASAETEANYVLDGGLAASSATLGGDLRTVSLVLSPAMSDNQEYTLTVSNVRDLSLENVIAPNTQVVFSYVTWMGQDIGVVNAAGSHDEDAGVWTIEGSGRDIWNNDDEFHFVYQPFSGNGTVTARVLSVTNTDSWAKAGVMLRETLDATSTHAMNVVTPSNGVSFQRRLVTGQQSYHTTVGGLNAPYWVRLVRQGNTFTAYRSPNGSDWTLVGSDTIVMAQPDIYVGLCVTSHNDGALCTAVFDNVSIVPADAEPPTADIVDVTPDPRSTAVDQIQIVFSEPVTGLDLADMSLTLDGGADLLTGGVSLSTSDYVTWTLGAVGGKTTTPGTYTLTLTAAGSEIEDAAGNPLAGDASDTWVMEVSPPENVVVSGPAEGDEGDVLNYTGSATGSGPMTYTWDVSKGGVWGFHGASGVDLTGFAFTPDDNE